MRQIKDVLRLKLELRHSHQHIASALGISKGVVAKYIKLASDAGLYWPQIQPLSETDLHHRLFGSVKRSSGFLAPDYARIHQELRRKGMTLMLDFANHYGTTVLPARPRRPQDKAKAESAVQVVERWILMRLRHHKFDTVDEVNEAIVPLLERLNAKAFQKLPGSRASVFAEIDAPALRPLPTQAWEMATYKTVKVHIDSHVEFDEHYYSVPHALISQTLEVRATQKAVEILYRGERVATHARSTHKRKYTKHLPHSPV
jgi:transposase